MQLSEREFLKFNGAGTDNPKRCHRCEGIMVYQKFYGPHEHFWGWRCICCGEIVDSLILENRNLMATGQLRR
jgi:hypothetical protein